MPKILQRDDLLKMIRQGDVEKEKGIKILAGAVKKFDDVSYLKESKEDDRLLNAVKNLTQSVMTILEGQSKQLAMVMDMMMRQVTVKAQKPSEYVLTVTSYNEDGRIRNVKIKED